MLNFLSFEVLPPDGQRPCQGGIQISSELAFVCGCSWGRKPFLRHTYNLLPKKE